VAIQNEALEQAAAIALAEYSTIHAVAANLSGFAPAPWGLYYYDTIRRRGDD
jgi:peptide/nickel transport system substrate-binding protein